MCNNLVHPTAIRCTRPATLMNSCPTKDFPVTYALFIGVVDVAIGKALMSLDLVNLYFSNWITSILKFNVSSPH